MKPNLIFSSTNIDTMLTEAREAGKRAAIADRGPGEKVPVEDADELRGLLCQWLASYSADERALALLSPTDRERVEEHAWASYCEVHEGASTE